MQKSHVRQMVAFAVAASLMAGAGCRESQSPPKSLAPEDVPRLAVVVSLANAPEIVQVRLRVTAPDLRDTLRFALTIQDSTARGTAIVPPGAQRKFTLQAFDSLQIMRYEGSTTVDVISGVNPPLTITMLPVAPSGEIPIIGSVSSYVITVAPASDTLVVGTQTGLAATIRDASGQVVTGVTPTWRSLDTTIAAVDNSGTVSARAVGQTSISASYSGATGTATILVSPAAPPPPAPVTTVTVTLNSSSLTVGQNTQATAVTKDSAGNTLTGRTVTWSTSDANIATVSSAGLVTARSAGSAMISATSEGHTGTAPITIQPVAVATVTVAPGTISGLVGGSAQLTATARDAGGAVLTGRPVTWSSSATTVASVSASGLVSFTGQGAATITATVEGKTGTAQATVSAPPPPPPPTVGEPVYSASNPDHKLHLEETWANLTDIAQLFTARRSDGGPPWVQEYGTTLLHRYLGTSGDGYGSARYVTIDFTEKPPIPPDSHCNCYHWYMGSGDDNALGTDWIRGFNSGGWLNKPVKDAVVYEWAMRERGTNFYEGKHVDIGAGESGGIGRILFDHFFDPFGIGGDYNCGDALCQLYYTNTGRTPRYPNLPPTSHNVAPAIHRSQSANLPGAAGSSFVVYKQNVNWGLNAGQFIWTPKAGDVGPTNADGRGTNTKIWEAGWQYYKLQITREPATTPYVYGSGRLEMWIGPTPGSMVKVMDFQGDPGQLSQGKVWIAPSASTTWTETVHWFQPTARVYMGGAIVDLGTVRIWSHSR